MTKFLVIVGIFALATACTACKPRREDAGSALEGNVALTDSPPSVLYHFGPYRFLRGYRTRPTTFTPAEWGSMPSVSPKYGGASRAGFYVSQHPAYNERYEDEDLENPKDDSPWMLTLRLKAECLEPGRWLNVRSTKWTRCDSNGLRRGQDILQSCDNEISQRNARDRIGVVRDFWWEGWGFWYVTDRDCIESLDASPEGFLTAAATVPEFWRMAPYTSNKPRTQDWSSSYEPGQVDFVILARALFEATPLNPALLAKLADAAAATDIASIKEPLTILTKTAAVCAAKGQSEALRKELRTFVEKFDSGRFRAEGLSFARHAKNLTRIGLARLLPDCNPNSPSKADVDEDKTSAFSDAAGT